MRNLLVVVLLISGSLSAVAVCLGVEAPSYCDRDPHGDTCFLGDSLLSETPEGRILSMSVEVIIGTNSSAIEVGERLDFDEVSTGDSALGPDTYTGPGRFVLCTQDSELSYVIRATNDIIDSTNQVPARDAMEAYVGERSCFELFSVPGRGGPCNDTPSCSSSGTATNVSLSILCLFVFGARLRSMSDVGRAA